MKALKIFLLLGFMIIGALGFTACSSDDNDDDSGGASSGQDYVAVTINGKAYKREFMKGLNVGIGSYQEDNDMITIQCPEVEMEDFGDFYLYVTVYEHEGDFLKMKTGKYDMVPYYSEEKSPSSFITNWPYFYGDTKAFDSSTMIDLYNSNSEYETTSGSIIIKSITKTSVSLFGTTENGYTMEGTFDCKMENADDGDMIRCKGQFRITYCP